MHRLSDELINSTYLYCYKRLSDTNTAQDLAQEILFEAVKAIRGGTKIESFYPWYWRLAANRYARYIDRKNSDSSTPIETLGGSVAVYDDTESRLIFESDCKSLYYALSRAAKIHRQIIVMYYYSQLPLAEIANRLALPVGTVKSRLFEAKRKLKERIDNVNTLGKSSFAPAEFNCCFGFNCSKQNMLMNEKIAEQIVIICRNEPKTVNEIADEMGVAPVYLESFIDKLLDAQIFKEPTRGKYQTDVLVFHRRDYDKACAASANAFLSLNMGEKITNALYSVKDEITAQKFYGNDFDYSYLLWILYVYAADKIGVRCLERYSDKWRGKIAENNGKQFRMSCQYCYADEQFESAMPKISCRPWSNLHNWFNTDKYGKVEYINDFEVDCIFGNRNGLINSENVSLILRLAENPDLHLNEYEKTMAAALIEHGILKKQDDSLTVMIPIISDITAFGKIEQIIDRVISPLVPDYCDAIANGAENALLPHTRPDLLEELVHWEMRMMFQPTGYLFGYAIDDAKTVQIPEDYFHSPAGLWIRVWGSK